MGLGDGGYQVMGFGCCSTFFFYKNQEISAEARCSYYIADLSLFVPNFFLNPIPYGGGGNIAPLRYIAG